MHPTLPDLFDLSGQSGCGEEGDGVEIGSERQGVVQLANDRAYSLMWALGAESGTFVCECDRASCSEGIAMTPSEYVRLRDRQEHVFAEGHDRPLS
jgi:hypothetical protein